MWKIAKLVLQDSQDLLLITHPTGLPWWLSWLRICLQCRRPGFDPWIGNIPWRGKWQLTPVFLPGEYHGQRSLAGYRTWFLNIPKTLIAHDHYIACGHFQINCFEIFLFLCALSQCNLEITQVGEEIFKITQSMYQRTKHYKNCLLVSCSSLANNPGWKELTFIGYDPGLLSSFFHSLLWASWDLPLPPLAVEPEKWSKSHWNVHRTKSR